MPSGAGNEGKAVNPDVTPGSPPVRGLKLRFLGTGAENADPSRAESSTLVSCGELRMLVDVGRGSIMRLAQSGVGVGEITAVLLTHLHLDHVAELPSLIRIGWTERAEPLRIIGPAGTHDMVSGIVGGAFRRSFRSDRAYLAWLDGGTGLADPPPLIVTDLEPDEQLEVAPLIVRAAKTEHGGSLFDLEDWVCLAYRIEHAGIAVAFSGDTGWSDDLVQLARDADLLAQNCYCSHHEASGVLDQIEAERFFATGSVAGRLAADAGVGHLVLTHFGLGADMNRALAEAAEHFPGQITLAADHMSVSLEPSNGRGARSHILVDPASDARGEASRG